MGSESSDSCWTRATMKIDELEVIGLTGGTVDGGWPQGHEPQDDLHALVRISCEGGLEGWGSCFTSASLVNGAIELLWPMLSLKGLRRRSGNLPSGKAVGGPSSMPSAESTLPFGTLWARYVGNR